MQLNTVSENIIDNAINTVSENIIHNSVPSKLPTWMARILT